MERTQTLKPETSLFVEALQAILQAEDKVYSGLTSTYGEKKGEELWYKEEVYTLLESAKREVKLLIGDSVEFALVGGLEDSKTKGED